MIPFLHNVLFFIAFFFSYEYWMANRRGQLSPAVCCDCDCDCCTGIVVHGIVVHGIVVHGVVVHGIVVHGIAVHGIVVLRFAGCSLSAAVAIGV